MREELNATELCGIIADEPVFSHENHGQVFYRFPLEVARLSGQVDRIDILALTSTLAAAAVTVGAHVRVLGQLRTYNNRSSGSGGRRLVISVLANIISPWEGEAHNSVFLRGTICKEPVLRRTPLGRSICDVMLAVNRRYGRSDYLPCIAWGQLAIQIGAMSVGEPLELQGRIQSRQYNKIIDGQSEERTAYEVSIMQLCEGETEMTE